MDVNVIGIETVDDYTLYKLNKMYTINISN